MRLATPLAGSRSQAPMPFSDCCKACGDRAPKLAWIPAFAGMTCASAEVLFVSVMPMEIGIHASSHNRNADRLAIAAVYVAPPYSMAVTV